MNESSSWIDRLYTHFLSRDIIFAISGGVLLYTGRYALCGDLRMPAMTFLEVAGVLAASYFAGITLYMIASKTPLITMATILRWYDERLLVYDRLRKKGSAYAITDIERRFFLSIAFGSIGAACLLSGLGLLIFWLLDHLLSWEHLGDQPTAKALVVAVCVTMEGAFLLFEARSRDSGLARNWKQLTALAA